MLQWKCISLILLILVYWKSCDFADLPRWVHRVESCPDPNNISQWIAASKNLNCRHNLNSILPSEQTSQYHCLPTSFLNETVEFCSTSVPVAPGNCPVYNYKYGPNEVAAYYNCSAFTSGCPREMFHSKYVFKYSECLKINREEECFEATANCSKSPTRSILETITHQNLLKQTSTMSTTNEKVDSMSMIKMPESEEHSIRILYIMLAILGVLILIMAVGGYLLHKRKHRFCKRLFLKAPNSVIMTDLELEDYRNRDVLCKTENSSMTSENHEHPRIIVESQTQEGNSACGSDDTGIFKSQTQTGNLDCSSNESGSSPSQAPIDHGSDDSGLGQDDVEERKALIEKIHKGATNWRYNDLLEKIKKKMTHDVFKRIKRRLKDRLENTDIGKIKDTDDLLDYLDKEYLAVHNVIFLQGLFEASKAPELSDICSEYAKNKEQKMTFFERKILERDHTKVTYVINCANVSCYTRPDLEKLRETVALFTNALYDDIFVCGVKDGCVIVTFMIRNCLIPTLRALYLSEKRSMDFQQKIKYKIIKVEIQDDAIYMSDRLLTVEKLKTEAKISRCTANELETNTDDLIDIKHDNLERTEDMEKNLQARTTIEALETNEQDESQKMKRFLEESFSCMTDDTFKCMKSVLQDFMDEESIKKMDKASLLNEMSQMIKLQYNMDYLEWIFENCGEKDLVDRCQKFSLVGTFPLTSFQTKVRARRGNQVLEIHIMELLEVKTFKTELQNLRKWIANKIYVHPGEILMTALQTNPIVVTYTMRLKPARAFLKFLETDDGQIDACRNRVKKVIIEKKVITIGSAINGKKYLHLHLRSRGNQPSGLKKQLAYVVDALGIKRDGREVYIRTISPKNDGKDIREESSSAKAFIEKHWNSLLMNLEPCTLLKVQEIASCFDKDDIAKIECIGNRREKSEFFLNKCKKLPKEEFEKIAQYIEESVPSSKLTLSAGEHESAREWIKQKREKILEEIDTDVIETTMNYMEDVPNEVKVSWTGSQSRKQKGQNFLDFVLQRDDGVMALKKTIKEMEFDKN